MIYRKLLFAISLILSTLLTSPAVLADENTPQTLPAVHTEPITTAEPTTSPDIQSDTSYAQTSRLLAPADETPPAAGSLYAKTATVHDDGRSKSLDLFGAILGLILMATSGLVSLARKYYT